MSVSARPAPRLVFNVRAFSQIELLLVAGCLLLLAAPLVLLSFQDAGRRRTQCAEHLRIIAQAAHVYANDGNGYFPVGAFARQYDPEVQNHGGGVEFIGAMGLEYAKPTVPEGQDRGPLQQRHSNSRNVFLLTRYQVTADKFICPADARSKVDDFGYSESATAGQAGSSGADAESKDGEAANRNRNGAARPRKVSKAADAPPARPFQDRFDFKGWPYLSYGYQSPYSANFRMRVDMSFPTMALFADRGPAFVADEPRPDKSVPDKPSAGLKGALKLSGSEQQILDRPEGEWRPFNSRNHGGEGQTLLFMDAHAEFRKRPLADADNIYSGADPTVNGPLRHLVGRWPENNRGPLDLRDNLIIP